MCSREGTGGRFYTSRTTVGGVFRSEVSLGFLRCPVVSLWFNWVKMPLLELLAAVPLGAAGSQCLFVICHSFQRLQGEKEVLYNDSRSELHPSLLMLMLILLAKQLARNILFVCLQDKNWWDQPKKGGGAKGNEHPHPEAAVGPQCSQSGRTSVTLNVFCVQQAENVASPLRWRVCFLVWGVQATAQLREELQSKEKEHELAVHTLRDQVTLTHTQTK